MGICCESNKILKRKSFPRKEDNLNHKPNDPYNPSIKDYNYITENINTLNSRTNEAYNPFIRGYNDALENINAPNPKANDTYNPFIKVYNDALENINDLNPKIIDVYNPSIKVKNDTLGIVDNLNSKQNGDYSPSIKVSNDTLENVNVLNYKINNPSIKVKNYNDTLENVNDLYPKSKDTYNPLIKLNNDTLENLNNVNPKPNDYYYSLIKFYNEDNVIVNADLMKKIMTSPINKCICKIIINNGKKNKTGTGFFCNIPEKKIKLLVTNNHIIDEQYLIENNTILLSIDMETEIIRNINLKKARYKLTNKEYDFTIIEILKDDKIKHYLTINKDSYEKDDKIFAFQYPEGGKLQLSFGKIIEKKKDYLLYDIGTKSGSSGSPIISMKNLNVLGLHKGCLKKGPKDKLNIGIPIELIIDKIDFSYFQISSLSEVNLFLFIILF